MSLVRNRDAYRAYCNLCFYTNQIPLSYDKWEKQSHITKNRTAEDIKKSLTK